jgi:hypothetical protein
MASVSLSAISQPTCWRTQAVTHRKGSGFPGVSSVSCVFYKLVVRARSKAGFSERQTTKEMEGSEHIKNTVHRPGTSASHL